MIHPRIAINWFVNYKIKHGAPIEQIGKLDALTIAYRCNKLTDSDRFFIAYICDLHQGWHDELRVKDERGKLKKARIIPRVSDLRSNKVRKL